METTKPKGQKGPKVELGRQYTGRREVLYDTLSGLYRESLPRIAGYELQVQAALLRAERPAPPSRSWLARLRSRLKSTPINLKHEPEPVV